MLPDITVKIILAAFLFLFLIYPVYKFIFLISARKNTLEEFNLKKNKIKKKVFNLCNYNNYVFFFNI